MADGHHITRIQLKEIHSSYFTNGCEASLCRIKQVGKNALDVKIRLQNETGDGHFVRKLLTISRDGKVATSMTYTATFASLYPKDSVKMRRRPRYYYTGSTIVECAVAADRETYQRYQVMDKNQIRLFFVERNAAARRALKKCGFIPRQARQVLVQNK